MNVVGFVGFKQSGKDTAAAALVNNEGFTRIGFADSVKEMALVLNPYILEAGTWLNALVDIRGWEEAKKISEVRRFLQVLGTEGVRSFIGEDSWLRAWDRKAQSLRKEPFDSPRIVVPDVRFQNEAQFLRRKYGALLIRIERPGQDTSDLHESEQEQLGIEVQMTLSNHKDIDWLHNGVRTTWHLWKELSQA
jgi:hypothetical protein